MNKKMKRFLASLTAAAAMSSVCLTPLADMGVKLPLKAIEASAAEVITSGDYQYYLDDNGAVIREYTGTAAEVTIPSELDGNKVYAIGSEAFEENKTITSVVIPSNIKRVGSSAFHHCSNLTSVSFSEGLEYLGSYAFTDTGITEVTLPTTLKEAPYPFEGSNVEKATFAEGTELIPSWIFTKCTTLKEVNVPESVKRIGNNAFNHCELITDFTFHEGIEYLGSYAFSDTGITEVTLPSTLEDAPYPFEGSNVEKATFAEGTELIPSWIFTKCTTLKEVNVPESVKRIGNNAFNHCELITDFTFHEGIEYLGSYAFTDTGITEVTLPTTLKEAPYPFEGSNVEKATFAEGTELIPSWIFNRCTKLKEVNVPKSVKRIGSDAFNHCKLLNEFTFHEGIEYIGSYAFSDTGITEVTLPSTLEDAPYPFEGSNVEKATFADGATIVPNWTFNKCSTLKEVILPETITKIGSDAFNNCSSLTEIDLHEGIEYLGNYAFTRTDITEITLPSTLKTASYPFENSSIQKAKFADGIKAIPSNIFEKCNTLKEVTLPESVTAINDNAFEYCYSLNEITLPSNLERLGSDCFRYSGLKSIVIPDSVTKIGYSAFDSCNKLKTATIGSGVKNINNKAFFSCTSLEKVSFTSAKLKLDNNSFKNCRSLAEVDYPNTELTFDKTAFQQCYSLKDMSLVYLKRPDSAMTITTENAAVNGIVDFTVEFDALAGHYSEDTDFAIELTVPKGVTVLPDTFKTEEGSIDIDTASSIKIPFSSSKGKLTFSAMATESGTYDIDADLVFTDAEKGVGERTEPIHSVRFTADVLSLSTPTIVNDFKTRVSGTGPKGQIIEIYVDGELAGNPTADKKTGKFDIPIELPEGENGTEYVLKAACGDAVTSNYTVTYSKDEPAIKSVKLGINGKDAGTDITDVFTKCTSPVMYLRPDEEFSFAVDLTNSKNTEKVFITSTKGDKITKIEAKYDEESGLWVAKGFFDGKANYVPGTLNVVVLSTAKYYSITAAKLEINYSEGYFSRPGNIRFAIDPSGIVYEAAPSNPVSGAEVTVYYMDEDGNAVLWDGTDYDQKNPLLTDDFGAYAWDVPEGEWKVVCKAEGFETMESDWVEVPPAQTGINFSLVSTAAPEVTDISPDGSSINLKFSKYMLPDSVNTDSVRLDAGTDIEITPNFHDSSEEVTDEFTISGDFTDVIDVKVSVTEGCRSYADTSVVPYEQSVHMNDAEEPETTTTTTAETTTTTTTTAAPDTTTTTEKAATTTSAEPVTTTTTHEVEPVTSTTTTTTAAETFKNVMNESIIGTWDVYKYVNSDDGSVLPVDKSLNAASFVFTDDFKCMYIFENKVEDTTQKFELFWTADETATGGKDKVLIYAAPNSKAYSFDLKEKTFTLLNGQANDNLVAYASKIDDTVTTTTTTTAPVTTTTTAADEPPVTTTTQTEVPETGGLGDFDGNGVINAVDASYILSLYAELSTSDRQATEAEKATNDVNKDGKVNAVDASYVLSYYAYISTNKKISIEEYLENN